MHPTNLNTKSKSYCQVCHMHPTYTKSNSYCQVCHMHPTYLKHQRYAGHACFECVL